MSDTLSPTKSLSPEVAPHSGGGERATSETKTAAERIAMRARSSGPDFLSVGMQKTGTGWLYDQLKWHPSIWLPPVKEIHYLVGQGVRYKRPLERR